MSNDFYSVGDHNVICDICGKKRKRSQCRMQWDGILACLVTNCWSPKHPNEYPRPTINDGLPVANARPRESVANRNYITVPGINKWTDTWLLWEDINLRWDDDPSQTPLFHDGNP